MIVDQKMFAVIGLVFTAKGIKGYFTEDQESEKVASIGLAFFGFIPSVIWIDSALKNNFASFPQVLNNHNACNALWSLGLTLYMYSSGRMSASAKKIAPIFIAASALQVATAIFRK